MKTLWNALAVIAIAHLLALVGLLGWLGLEGRLNTDRVEAIRGVLAETADEEQARLDEEARLAAEALEAAGASEGESRPVSAEEQVREQNVITQMDAQISERTRREAQDLRAGITRERDAVRREREELDRLIANFERMRQRIAEVEGSAQFQKALSVLRGLRPGDAVTLLKESITAAAGDADSGQMLTVISYLDALPDRQRAKIMNEFVKQDPALAAELLERLRTKGVPELDGAEPDADSQQSDPGGLAAGG